MAQTANYYLNNVGYKHTSATKQSNVTKDDTNNSELGQTFGPHEKQNHKRQ